MLLKRGNNKVFNNKPTCFLDFLKMDTEQRNTVLAKEFTNEQIEDINKALESIPTYDVNIDVFTEGFDDILVDDEVSIKVTVTRNNLQEEQEVGLAHSLGFTELYEEKILIALVASNNNTKILTDNAIKKVTNRTTEHIFSNRFPEPKKIKVTCDIISLDYKGINISKDFEINVCKTSEKRKEHYKDLEKRQIKKIEPSYFQTLLNGVLPIGGDEDEEEEEEEDDKKDKKDDKNEGGKNEENKEENKENEEKKDEENDEENKKDEEKKDDKNDEEHEKQD